MESLIPMMNKIQDVFNMIPLAPNSSVMSPTLASSASSPPCRLPNLPQIVVIGSQSSGKSSVLESIVGHEFLPRGLNIVTRCPLVIQLIHLKDGPTRSHDGDSFGEFLHLPGRQFKDLNQSMRSEIERQMNVLAGNNKGISRRPIHIKIYSKNVVDLTLVDLPGMTKIPVGDQPPDIEYQIRELLLEYTKPSNSLILAVTPANLDLVNSEALKFAKEVDPDGSRTIGVLTKLDLMDAGTHALDILLNRSPPFLHHGFIGVICRSQQDLVSGKPIGLARQAEQEYFMRHPVYATLKGERTGTPYLMKALNRLLYTHIRDKLPELKAMIHALLSEKKSSLRALGDDPNFHGDAHRGSLLLKLLTGFANDYGQLLDGSFRHGDSGDASELKSPNGTTFALVGGAKLNHLFMTRLPTHFNAAEESSPLSSAVIRLAIENATGTRPCLFVPEPAFESLVKSRVSGLESPSLHIVDLAHEELLTLVSYLLAHSPSLTRYPALANLVGSTTAELLRERLEPTKQLIRSLVAIEMCYINTRHPEFLKSTSALLRKGRAGEGKDVDPESPTSSFTSLVALHGSHSASASASASPSPTSASSIPSSSSSSSPSPSSLSTATTSPSTVPSSGLLGYLFNKKSSHANATSLSSAVNGPATLRNWMPPTPATLNTGAPLVYSSSSSSSGPTGPWGGHKSLSAMPPVNLESFESPDVDFQVSLLSHLITSYYAIVRSKLLDSLPKAIMYSLVQESRLNLFSRLVSEAYQSCRLDELLEEDDSIALQRDALQTQLDALKSAQKILDEG